MSNIDKLQIRDDIDRRKAMPDFGIGPDSNIARLKVIQETQRSFGFEVVEALLDELEAAGKRIAELEAKLETADKLHDSAFRHGLQHGFSFGQTDNQAGFEECLSAYSTGKGGSRG